MIKDNRRGTTKAMLSIIESYAFDRPKLCFRSSKAMLLIIQSYAFYKGTHSNHTSVRVYS